MAGAFLSKAPPERPEDRARDDGDRGHFEHETDSQLAAEQAVHKTGDVADQHAGRNEQGEIGQPPADFRRALARVQPGFQTGQPGDIQEDGKRHDEEGDGPPDGLPDRLHGRRRCRGIGKGQVDELKQEPTQIERADVQGAEEHQVQERLAGGQIRFRYWDGNRELDLGKPPERATYVVWWPAGLPEDTLDLRTQKDRVPGRPSRNLVALQRLPSSSLVIAML